MPSHNDHFSSLQFILGIFLIFTFSTLTAQVGIGTENPAPGSALQIDSTTGALVPPRMSNTQMLAIPQPLEGSIVYNTSYAALYMFSSGKWNNVSMPDLPSLIMSKEWPAGDNNNLVATGNNAYYKFPLGIDEIVANNAALFTVTSNGTLRIEQKGNYLITAGFSVDLLPPGGHKYIIAVYKGTTLVGYLVRGNVDMESEDEFGISGVMVLPLNAGDVISLQYVLNNDGAPLNARFFKIGVVKM